VGSAADPTMDEILKRTELLSKLVSEIFDCDAVIYINPPFEISNGYNPETKILSINELTENVKYAAIIKNISDDSKMSIIKQVCYQYLNLSNKLDIMSATKDVFLSSMNHDIRTSLNSISSMLDLIQTTQITQKQRDYVDIMKKGEVRLLEVINNIVDFAKLVSGKVQMASGVFNVTKCLNEVINPYKSDIDKKKLNVSYMVDTSIPDNLIGDYSRIKQLLNTFVSNAIKFTIKGAVSIEIKGVARDEQYYQLVINVKDSGCGMTDEQSDMVFKMFEQPYDICDEGRTLGSGLSLAIAKKICEIYGGSVSVNSAEGSGSEFTAVVVLKYIKSEHVTINCDTLVDKRVLILDEKNTRKLQMAKLLLELGMKPLMCSNIDEALLTLSMDRTVSIALIAVDSGDSNNLILNHAKDLLRTNNALTLISIGEIDDPDLIFSFKLQAEILTISPSNNTSPKHRIKEVLVRAASGKSHNLSSCLVSQSKLDKIQILIADNYEDSVTTIIEMLNHIGITNIHKAKDGIECLCLLSDNTYNILFLDVRMPKLDGCKMMEVYTSSTPKAKRPVVVCISADSSPEDITKYMSKYEMDLMLPKPINYTQLKEFINMIGEDL
jgi:signal transduction histidine kinase/CheY-like chemotaxis protein